MVKPSEFTPVSAILLTEVLHDAGVPPGVFNLINGDGPTVGAAICRHADVDLVSFTGSTRAGVLVAEAAAKTAKRVCQELGGKSAHIILPDADLEAATRWNVARGFSNTSPSCHAPTRILVQEKQVAQVLDLLQREVDKVRVGDPQDPATTMGPVVNRSQFERIQAYIKSGIDEGARLVCGGLGRPPGIERGFYIRPTIFADVTPTMTIAREEIFGPVLAVMSYSDLNQAVEIANDTAYGLGGYLSSPNPKAAREIGARMRAGRIFLNGAGRQESGSNGADVRGAGIAWFRSVMRSGPQIEGLGVHGRGFDVEQAVFTMDRCRCGFLERLASSPPACRTTCRAVSASLALTLVWIAKGRFTTRFGGHLQTGLASTRKSMLNSQL